MSNLGNRGKMYYLSNENKGVDQLICAFVSRIYAKSRFSHDVAQTIIVIPLNKSTGKLAAAQRNCQMLLCIIWALSRDYLPFTFAKNRGG